MLYLSSFLFGITSYYAVQVQNQLHHIGWLLQYGCSILHHAYYTDERSYFGGRVIGVIDRAVAHGLFVNILWNSLRMRQTMNVVLVWIHLAYIMGVYFLKIRFIAEPYPRGTVHLPHLSMHIATFVGGNIFLCEWDRQRSPVMYEKY